MADYIFSDTRDTIEIKWDIHKFLHLPHKNGVSLKSPEFYLKDAKFQIEVYPRGDVGMHSGAISLYMRYLTGSGETGISFSFKMLIDGCTGTIVGGTGYYSFVGEQSKVWGFKKFASRSIVNDYLFGSSSGIVTIIFCAQLRGTSSENASQKTIDITSQSSPALKSSVDIATQNLDLSSAISEKKIDLENLAQDLEKLFLCGDFSDVKIIVREQEFSAHKLVLSFRSPVFLAMFQHDMAENNTGVIKIADMNPEFFKDFLFFIYSGKFHCVTTKNAIELYKAADKYAVKGLKEECALKMKENLSLSTILDTLHIANCYEDECLLDSATQFFIENAEAIFKTNAWESFFLQKENSKLTKELMLKVLKKDKA